MPHEKLEPLLEAAAKLVTPSEKEENTLRKISSYVRSRLEARLEKEQVRPEIFLGGSYAKGTWLKGSADIDFFLLYPIQYSREQLEGPTIAALKEAMKGHEMLLRFAEHPYLEVFVEGVRINLVPCYKVEKGEWLSAADRSPFHTEYITSQYDEKLRLQARLLKKFVKTAGVYGAEVKIEGFSGYVCEVLTLRFRAFEKVLERLAQLKRGEVLSVENDTALAPYFNSFLVVLDPVDTTRNLGSAISTENVARLALCARRFLEKPALAYFREHSKNAPPSLPLKAGRPARELLERMLIVTFEGEKRSVDILWGQLKKSVHALSLKLTDGGFQVIRSQAASDEESRSAFLFLLEEKVISPMRIRHGPEFFRGNEVQKFLEKNHHRKPLLSWIANDGRIFSLSERKQVNAVKFLDSMLSDRKTIEKLGLSKGIQRDLARGYKIQVGGAFFQKQKKPTGEKLWLSFAAWSLVSSEKELVG